MTILEAIEFIEKQIPNPTEGLSEEVFLFISRLTPLLNIDLLIKDEKERTLLAWRDDEYAGKGWHLPGGIIRYKENIETRIKLTIQKEIKTEVKVDFQPLAINEIIIQERKTRAHFISILYKGFVPSSYIPINDGINENQPGYLMWHDKCPSNLIKYHEIYRKYI